MVISMITKNLTTTKLFLITITYQQFRRNCERNSYKLLPIQSKEKDIQDILETESYRKTQSSQY